MYQRLPPDLHYPIIITKIVKEPGETVKRNDTLFLYSYVTKVMQGNRYDDEEVEVEKKFVTAFKSDLEGRIDGYFSWAGATITGPQDICNVEEECQHDVVYLGMCSNCGKDLTQEQNGPKPLERAPINMTHDRSSLTISKGEAARLDEDSKKKLLAAKKLSLVVDLDQTIIHAAVEPTIGEWMKDPENPNYEAVKDVGAFQLMDDGPGMRGCWYYIKMRPGLQEFLKNISEIYELHIYTMGTRQYAKKVTEVIDPDEKFFGDRILSRDESGSMTAKNLERLFPIDTKMVVIIDDRGDVWDWSPNLLRVKPFDFFQGIGDINSSFLPKKEEIVTTPRLDSDADISKPELGAESNGDRNTNGVADEDLSGEIGKTDTSAIEKLAAMGGSDDPKVREEQSKGQEEVIITQIEEKPLLKKQQEQDEKDEAEAAALATQNGEAQASQSTESESDSSESSEASTKLKARHAILKNDDEELIHLQDSLTKVHAAFFKEYERKRLSNKGGRVARLAGGRKASIPDDDDGIPSELKFVPDIKKIMPAMKMRVLGGVVMVFSCVLPLGTDVQKADLTRWAQNLGARVVEKISDKVTHVIAVRPGTAKVNKARKIPSIKVVGTGWLLDSMQRWRKLDETPYFLEGVGGHKGASSENGEIPNPADVASQDLGLSDSEEDASGLDTVDERPNKRPRLDTSVSDFLAEDVEYSPASVADVDWASADAEVAEFLGSDIDSGSDTESVASSLSYREKRAAKRAHNEMNDDDDAEDDQTVSKRKRRSHLKAVANASSDLESVGNTPRDESLDDAIARDPRRVEGEDVRQQAEDSDDELLREFAEGLE